MRYSFSFMIACLVIVLTSCGETKRIYKGNIVYSYQDNQGAVGKPVDSAIAINVTKSFNAKVEDKGTYYLLKYKPSDVWGTIKKVEVKAPYKADKVALSGKLYHPEPDLFTYESSLKFGDYRFGLQALTIPIKIRPHLENDSLFPNQVETGVNIGFAPFIKYNYNVYSPNRKFMGRALNQYSLTSGILLGMGATDLKNAGNAPGIKSDRKSGLFTYGTFLMLGVNNINFGYAIGWDKVIGEGRKYWVYQGNLWHGIIIALDIIK